MTKLTLQSTPDGRYGVQVIADGSGRFCGNGLRFANVESARAYADDLAWRWTSVRDWRVIDLGDTNAVVWTMTGGDERRGGAQ